jgi:nicotinamidase-related amidase
MERSVKNRAIGLIARRATVADRDYRAVVVADGCSDKDPEVQRFLLEKIFTDQARVAMVEVCIGISKARYIESVVTRVKSYQ